MDESKLRAAAFRNGRECCDAAVLISPLPWSAELQQEIMDGMAVALAQSFPGGPSAFLASAGLIVAGAREGFEARLVELLTSGACQAGGADAN